MKETLFMKKYKILKLKDCIIQLNTGLNPRQNFSLGKGTLKYITAKNLNKSGSIDFSKCDFIDEDAKKIIHKRSNIQIGDILFSSRAPVGHCHLIQNSPDYYDIGESIFSIRVNNQIVLPEYMCLYLTSDYFVKSASKHTTGSIIQEIRIANLMNMNIIIPTEDVQRKISKIMMSINRKIENNNQINNNLEELMKTIYQRWFIEFEFPNEEGKPYKSSGGKLVYNKLLKRNIPQNWFSKNITNFITWEGTSQPPKSSFIYEPKEGYIRFIQNRDYEDGSHMTYIPKNKALGKCNRYDILIDKYGDAGRIRFGLEGAYNVALAKITVNNEFYREYIRSVLSSEAIYNYLHNSSMASTRASLNENNISYINLVIPEKNIIEKYNKIANNYVESKLKITDENQRLKELKEYILPLLMNGQINVDDIEI